MARIGFKESSRFEQDADKSYAKWIISTIPFAVILIWFVVAAYQRPDKAFYNLPAYINDDYNVRKAADETGSLVPLIEMCYIVLSFAVFFAFVASYFLGFLAARHNLIETFLEQGIQMQGNVVFDKKCWAMEFRYYGYCSYQHPDPASDPRTEDDVPTIVRKRTRLYEPYTRELVTILCLPGYPRSGQGKDDMEYAHLMSTKNRPREKFFGWFCVGWVIVCLLVTLYILHQLKVVNEEEHWANIVDDYDVARKGWIVFWLFIVLGIGGVAMGGTAIAWTMHKRWLLSQGILERGDLSVHGFDGVVVSESQASRDEGGAEDYHRMSGSGGYA